MQKLIKLSFVLLLGLSTLATPASAYSQSTEERFQDLFITAGYSTAFGAAMGAALLAFANDPASRLSYVAMGASLGFIGGSLLGTYMIFSPLVVENSHPSSVQSHSLWAHLPSEKRAVAIQPIWDMESQTLLGLGASWSLVRF
jgi:hypothetical protein